MAYLQSYRGDYLAAYRGDPGLFGNIFKGIKGAVGGFIRGGPISAIGGAVRGFTSRPSPQVRNGGQRYPGGLPILQMPGIPGFGNQRAPVGFKGKKPYGMAPTRRRMNVTNAKALRRAIRRTDGFVKLARKALKGTGYTITRRGATKKPMRIVEHGPGSVTVQR